MESNKTEKAVAKLRRLLDPKTFPKYDVIHNGKLYRYVSDDPLEECVQEVSLQSGALQ